MAGSWNIIIWMCDALGQQPGLLTTLLIMQKPSGGFNVLMDPLTCIYRGTSGPTQKKWLKDWRVSHGGMRCSDCDQSV